ncbi:hypothetical protein TSAR_000761 [Trichomalopsis sarcophagae]|uniref:Uncharacterized protein n=1 Tax=Trichomalopsis sarcophagae TaxID=543379 RepID=A0A232FGU4_9HYME|nr:hypothetical protein TSAR_000761 [Trichomalopsis sarcophagae]
MRCHRVYDALSRTIFDALMPPIHSQAKRALYRAPAAGMSIMRIAACPRCSDSLYTADGFVCARECTIRMLMILPSNEAYYNSGLDEMKTAECCLNFIVAAC